MPSAAIPVPTRPERWTPGFLLTRAALLAVLALAARERFALPQAPFADPDTWGYLGPGLTLLTGGGFPHIYGRAFVYPGFVWAVLALARDFRAVAVAQHVLGLGAGWLLWRCWLGWNETLRPARLPRVVRDALGVLMVAAFLLATATVEFEHTLRPEAVFPFFAVLSLWLTLALARAARNGLRAPAPWVLGGLLLFNTALVYFIKPGFGLAVGCGALPVLPLLWRRAAPRRRKLLLCAAPGLAVFLLLWLPEHVLQRSDPMVQMFLPETLLAVHADVIRDQLADDVVNNDPGPYAVDWLTAVYLSLDREIAAARAEPDPYPSLGFNPDYLIFRHSICEQLYFNLGPAGLGAFGQHCFLRAWLHRPGPMLAKVGRQLRVFYCLNCPAYRFSPTVALAEDYARSVQSFQHPFYEAVMRRYAPARAYLAAASREQAAAGTLAESGRVARLEHRAAHWYLALLGLAAVAGAAALLTPALRPRLGLAAALLALFYGYNFGSVLTVALVHSLDGTRYCTNQLAFTVLPEFAAAVLVAELLAEAVFRSGLRRRLARGRGSAGLAGVALALLGLAGCARPQYYPPAEPTDEEQATLERVNRARADPAAEGRRLAEDDPARAALAALLPGPRPPLALDRDALRRERRRALQMAAALAGSGGAAPAVAPPPGKTLEMLSFAGLAEVPRAAENGRTSFPLLGGPGAMVGIGVVPAHRLGAAESGGWVRAAGLAAAPPGRRFLLGVAYHGDRPGGGYAPGEGAGGVEVRVPGAAFYTRTGRGGGYALPLDGLAAGARAEVRFAGANGFRCQRWISVGETNQALDCVLPSRPPADLAGRFAGLAEIIRLRPDDPAGPRHRLRGSFTLRNRGGTASVPVAVRFFLVPPGQPAAGSDPAGPPAATLEEPALAPGAEATQTLKVLLGPDAAPRRGWRVLAHVDPEDRCLQAGGAERWVAAGGWEVRSGR